MDASFEKTSGAQTNRFLVNEDQDPQFSPKDCGLLFDLAEGYKQQNGGGPAPLESHHTTDPFFDERPTNGKRTSDHFDEETHDDDDEDDDFGPETDVDAVDDVLLSPSIAAARLLVEGDAGKEQDNVVQETFDVCMKETSALPIEAVLEISSSSGLVDNVGESGGEESEDEWNYFKGENKTDSSNAAQPDSQTQHATEEIESKSDAEIDDTMSSPLNPEAAPFVPVSPTPGSGPEGSALPSRLLDEVVSQSPQKPQPMDDINIPEASEFRNEVCTRLADLGGDEEYLNGHSDNSALSSQENLKETLHGNEKHLAGFGFGDDEPSDGGALAVSDVDEAEFDRVQKDTTDFCDVRVAQADRGFEDEGIDEELYERLKNKERDPMSMSFYQEKDEDTCETQLNPFDLNAVQILPDADDDFINDRPQPDNSVNSFVCGTEPHSVEIDSEVTAVEIDAAISDLDYAVTDEIGSFNASDANKSNPFDNPDICTFGGHGGIQEPFVDNISSNADLDDDVSALNVPSPLQGEEDLIRESPLPVMSPVPTQPDEFFDHMPKSPGPVHSPELMTQSPIPVAVSPEPATIIEPVEIIPEPISHANDFTTLSPAALSPEPFREPSPAALSPAPFGRSSPMSAYSPHPASPSPVPLAESPHPSAPSPAMSPAPVPEERDDCGFFEEKIEQNEVCQLSEMPITELQSGEISSSAVFDDDIQDVLVVETPTDLQQVSDFIENKSPETINSANEFSHEEICKPTEEEVKNEPEAVVDDFGHDFCTDAVETTLKTMPLVEESFNFNDAVPTMQNISNNDISPFGGEHTIAPDFSAQFEVSHIAERVVSPVTSTSPDVTSKIEISNEFSSLKENSVDVDPVLPDEPVKEENVIEDIVSIGTAAVAAAAGVAVVAAVATDKKTSIKGKPASPAVKKSTPSKTALSPTKPSAPKAASATAPIKKTTAAPLKSSTATPPKASAAAPRPRPAALTSPAAKPASKTIAAAPPKPKLPAAPKTAAADKKPLTNGVEAKREPVRRPVPGSVPAKTAVAAKTAAAPVKTTAPPTRTAPRPTTAPARPAAAAPKPAAARPASTATAAKPKPQPTPAARAPISKTTSTRAPAADKFTKETTNKQISASRPTPAPRAGLAPKSTDLKTTSKTTTKTSTTTVAPKSTNPPPIRRPTSATAKTTVTKTTTKTTTTKLVGGKTVVMEKLNGSLEKSIKEDDICMNGTPLITDIPLKDSSPQQVDNSLLPIIDAAAD